MNDEFEALGKKKVQEVAEWLQRVATECGAVVSDNNLEVIEATLKQQHERIAELEAELKPFRELKASWKSMRVPVLSAGGAGVEVEEVMVIYGSANNFNSTHGAYLADGYKRVGWQVLDDERVAVMWQRPARSEVEG